MPYLLTGQEMAIQEALSVFQDSEAPASLRLKAGIEVQNHFQTNRADSLRWISQAMLQYGQETQSTLWEAYGYKGLGAYQTLLVGNIDSARWYCQKALERTAPMQNALYANLLQNMGFLFYIDNQLDSSLQYMNKALPLAIWHNNQNLEGAICNSIGVIYLNQTNYAKALRYFERALKLSNAAGKVSIEINIARIFEQYGMFDFAAAHARNALNIAETLGTPDKLLSAYTVLISSGEIPLDSLEQWIQKAETLAFQQNNDVNIAKVHLTEIYIAVSARHLNESSSLVKAEKYALKAIELATKLRMPFLAIKPRIDLAHIRLIQKQFRQGLELIRENAPLMSAKGSELYSLPYHLTASELFESVGQIDSAYFHLNQIGLRTLIDQGKPIGMNRSEMVAYMDVLHKQTEETLAKEKAEAELQASVERNRRLKNLALFSFLGLFLTSISAVLFLYYRQKNKLAGELSAANTALLNEQENLQRSNAKLERFSNVVSHDILSNLDIVLSSGRALVGSSPKPEHLLQYHQITQNTARQLKDYCLQLLQEAQQKTDVANTALHDPMPVLERVRQRLNPALEEAGFQLDIRPLSPAPLSPVLCEQLFQNLLSNAIRHGATAPKPVLRVYETQTPSGRPAWVVEDNGPGIPPELRASIFTNTTQSPQHGKGQQMGLALLQASLREHQTQLHLEEPPNGGARFVLTFNTNE